MLRRTAVAAGILVSCICSAIAQNRAIPAARDDATFPGRQTGQSQQGRQGGGRGGDTARAPNKRAGRANGTDTTGGARGGRAGRNASIVLGAADIARVTRGTVEATIAVSGDLRAFESATIRSRLDGILEKVYVREGQSVAAGTVLAKYESSEQEASLRSADADVAAAKSDAETAAWNAEQSRELFKVGAIAERDLRLAEQAADAAKARLAAAEARQRAAANVVRDTRVVAPFAGAIEKRFVQDGENTPRGTQLFTMVRTATLELAGSVPARNSDDVKPGQTVRLTADGRAFTGRVSRVSPTIDPASRSVAVYLTVPNPRGLLKGNTFATGHIVTSTVNDALTVPTSALRVNTDGTRIFVYKILGDALEMAYVKTGITDEARGTVQIVEGLREQEQVVLGSPGTLGPGMKVQIIGNEGRGGRRGRGAAP